MASRSLPENAAVLYLRMSSAKQDKSIPAQRDELLKIAKFKGYHVVREYADPAVSGDDTEKRTGFLKLRSDCENGPDFSIVLVWHEDRFSRNDPLEYGYWLRPIRSSGVILETPTGRVDWESLSGRLLSLIGQEMRHDYLRQLSRNVARGHLAAAKSRPSGTGGTAPIGYKNNGEIDQEWAAIVRRIFEEYLKPGASLRSVCELLNREGIHTVRGSKWRVSSLRDILSNEKYTGSYVRFRYHKGKYSTIRDGEIASRRKSDGREIADNPIILQDHHEAIIDRKTFDKVQRKLTGQQRHTAHRTGHQYALSGLLRCGDCGGVMGGKPERDRRRRKVWRVYTCRTFITQGRSACHCNTVREDSLVDVVARKLQSEVFSEKAIDHLLNAYRKRLAAQRKGAPNDDGRLRKQIEKLNQQIDQGLNRLILVPERLVGTLSTKLDGLRVERDRLQAQLNAAGQQETGSSATDEKKVEEAARVLRDMREAFKDAKPEEIRELISPIVSKIDLHFEHVQEGNRNRNHLRHGEIVVRPTDPALSLLFGTSGTSADGSSADRPHVRSRRDRPRRS